MEDMENLWFGEAEKKEVRRPLPGYDDNLECAICKVARSKLKDTDNGATLAEFLEAAHDTFRLQEGRPASDIAQEVLQHIKQYVQRHPDELECLRCLKKQDVHRHFAHNHPRRPLASPKEFMQNVLQSMLHVSVKGTCDESGSLLKEPTNITLSIIDRACKVMQIPE